MKIDLSEQRFDGCSCDVFPNEVNNSFINKEILDTDIMACVVV